MTLAASSHTADVKNIIALDIDLNRIHAWSNRDGRVCYNAPDFPFAQIASHDTILVECWSPHLYVKNGNKAYNSLKGEITNRLRAVLWNSFKVGELYSYLAVRDIEDRMLVAPSSEWTGKFPEDVRQAMAGVTGQDNHDIRECRTMLFFYKKSPSKWKPYQEFLDGLTVKKSKAKK